MQMQKLLQPVSSAWLFRAFCLALLTYVAPGKLPAAPLQSAPAGGSAATPDGGLEMQIGAMYETQDRLDDAEKAYLKAFETGSPTVRQQARQAIQRVLARKNSFEYRHFWPMVSSFGKVVEPVLLAALVLGILWWPLKKLGERRCRRNLQVAVFVDATDDGSGAALRELIKDAVLTVQEYYKPRDRFRFGTFNSLIIVDSPEAPELAKLATEVVSGQAGKVLAALARTFLKPRYRITGMVQKVSSDWTFVVKLAAKGATIGAWDETYGGPNPVYYQRSIAFRVAMHLKDHVGASGNR